MAFILEYVYFHLLYVAYKEEFLVQFEFELHLKLYGHIYSLVCFLDRIHEANAELRVEGRYTVVNTDSRRWDLTL